MGHKHKSKRKLSRNNADLFEQALDLYLNKNQHDEALRILFKLAKAGYEKAFGEIGIIIYREKHDVKIAEEWFKKAEQEDVLLAPAAFYYGELLFIERSEWEKSKKYFKRSAEEGFEPAFAEYASILYLDKIDVDKAEVFFKMAEKANFLSAPHAHNYGELLIKERNEVERGNRYLDMAAADGY